MPRPKKDDPRDVNFTIRLSVAEVTALQRRARAAGRSVAAYTRAAVFAAPQDSAKVPSATPQPINVTASDLAAADLAQQVRRVGVNLNQIAHRMNELRLPPPDDLAEVLAEIRSIMRQTRAAL